MSGQQRIPRSRRACAGATLAIAMVGVAACTDEPDEWAQFCEIAVEPVTDRRWDGADAIVFFEPGVDPAESSVLSMLGDDPNVASFDVVDREAAIAEIRDYFWDRPDLASAVEESGQVPLSVRVQRVDDSRSLAAEIDDDGDVATVQYPEPGETDVVWGDVVSAIADAPAPLRAVLHQPGLAGTLELWRDDAPEELVADLELLVADARRERPLAEELDSEHRAAVAAVAAAYRSECSPRD
ncbi:MAG: hypothetical protein ACXIVQ_14760 [Acidimicrobiales bacterium]